MSWQRMEASEYWLIGLGRLDPFRIVEQGSGEVSVNSLTWKRGKITFMRLELGNLHAAFVNFQDHLDGDLEPL